MPSAIEVYLERLTSAIVPVSQSVTITPSDTAGFALCRALSVGAAGNVHVSYENGVEDTIYLSAGVWHPMNVVKVWATGTAATGIHAGY